MNWSHYIDDKGHWHQRLQGPQHWLGPPVVPFYPFLGEGSPTKIDYRKEGTLILTSLLEDLAANALHANNFYLLAAYFDLATG